MGIDYTIVTEPGQPDVRVQAEDELDALDKAGLEEGQSGSVVEMLPIGYGSHEPDEDDEA